MRIANATLAVVQAASAPTVNVDHLALANRAALQAANAELIASAMIANVVLPADA